MQSCNLVCLGSLLFPFFKNAVPCNAVLCDAMDVMQCGANNALLVWIMILDGRLDGWLALA